MAEGAASLNLVSRECSLQRFRLREDVKEMMEQAVQMSGEIKLSGRRSSKCKVPEVAASVVYLQNSKKTSVAGAE